MPAQHVVTIRGKKLKFDPAWSKADIARYLFVEDAGYTVTEVSNAVPMNYSQAHSVHKSMGKAKPKDRKDNLSDWDRTINKVKAGKAVVIQGNFESIAKATVPTARQKQLAHKQIKAAMRGEAAPKPPKLRPGIGKLRTPGHPGDVGAGECANCGFDLVVRKGPQYLLVHVNMTAEEHLAVTQFCMAVPRSLLE